jgi:hypothetical protein
MRDSGEHTRPRVSCSAPSPDIVSFWCLAVPNFFEIIDGASLGCLKRVNAENSVCSKLCSQPESAASW